MSQQTGQLVSYEKHEWRGTYWIPPILASDYFCNHEDEDDLSYEDLHGPSTLYISSIYKLKQKN